MIDVGGIFELEIIARKRDRLLVEESDVEEFWFLFDRVVCGGGEVVLERRLYAICFE